MWTTEIFYMLVSFLVLTQQNLKMQSACRKIHDVTAVLAFIFSVFRF